ncbi:MAG: hypothetical protein QW184_01885 [Nanopusillaceae archaeon]
MYNITKKAIESLKKEIESKLNYSNVSEYKINLADIIERFDVSASTAYVILRILRKHYETNEYDVSFVKSELTIKKKQHGI